MNDASNPAFPLPRTPKKAARIGAAAQGVLLKSEAVR
jgi:hypothetical protein